MSDPFSHAASSIALSGAHNTRLYPHDDESLFFFFLNRHFLQRIFSSFWQQRYQVCISTILRFLWRKLGLRAVKKFIYS